jgi:hypothetical protein
MPRIERIIEPPDSLPGGVLDLVRFGVLDDGPGRREAAGGHRLGMGKYRFH